MIDGFNRAVKHFELDESGHYPEPRLYSGTDTMTLACLPSLPIRVNELFEGMPL